VTTPSADLRRRVMGWRAAERREQALRASEGPPSPAAALDAAFELHELFVHATDGPDVVRAREVATARAAWRKVRERLACHPAGRTPR
jgi:hypothetical protein